MNGRFRHSRRTKVIGSILRQMAASTCPRPMVADTAIRFLISKKIIIIRMLMISVDYYTNNKSFVIKNVRKYIKNAFQTPKNMVYCK
ncbi:hypothetical protein H839_09923 [Parageobacillus genomosp. 1]|uniref:Uncharacterized protein n=1 Tax=Parageobacillus genomosp. 1 TaxID=1295642 RepID=A0ABC9VEH4_9BACL|nr:hypothetical protein H839_09923 [Parageobacillus genomosp. 1]